MSGSIKDRERRAAAAVANLRRSNTYEDWVAIGHGYTAGREWAMAYAGVNTTRSGAYSRARTQWLANNTWTDDPHLTHPTPSHAMWLIDNLAYVEAWRATLTADERLRYNHPTTIKRHFLQAQAGGSSGPGRGRRSSASAAPPQGSSGRPSKAAFDALKAALDQALAENAALQAQLAAGGGPAGYPDYPLLWLSPPFTRKEARAARDRMVKAVHPDAGGSTEQQQALNAEYQRALKVAT